MTTAYIALGSNLGERAAHLRGALAALQRDGEVRVVAQSAVYETAPVGGPAQPDYLNMVVAVETELGADPLLERCLAVEAEHGRVRRERWGPRTLDLDLLCYGEIARATERLTLPHPRMAERAFVLVPLAEVAPALKIGDVTVAELATRSNRAGLHRLGPLADVGEGRASRPRRAESDAAHPFSLRKNLREGPPRLGG
ncbi:MAG TPA: 2-amino-4-hydroxy-6-hydroxymethyldihydropteridine diphosphokinase [Opitutaceae bacterium]|nr:2-amino-4-hydroxy-6-hydroxymethyldihydropteridine diphosphokinase [Opitutaceae bacterium]